MEELDPHLIRQLCGSNWALLPHIIWKCGRDRHPRVGRARVTAGSAVKWEVTVKSCGQSGISQPWPRLTGRRISLVLFFAAYAILQGQWPGLRGIGLAHNLQSGMPLSSSENTEASLNAIETDIANNRLGEALPRLNDYLERHPNSWRAHYDLGYALFRSHEIGSSIKELSKSLELNLDNAQAHKILGLDCSMISRYDLAEVELTQAARLEPNSAEIHYFLARTHYTTGVYPLAEKEFETAIRLDPSYMKAYSNLGLTLEALGRNGAALKNYTIATQLDEQQKLRSEWPYVYLSSFYNHQRKSAEALDYAGKAIAINPGSGAAFLEMAKAYRSQGEWQKAADAARHAIAINSKAPDCYYLLGLALHKLGRQLESQQAMATFERLQQTSRDAVHEPLEHKSQEPLAPLEPQ
jgi:tetratricopeptide (TPR) repeat protein